MAQRTGTENRRSLTKGFLAGVQGLDTPPIIIEFQFNPTSRRTFKQARWVVKDIPGRLGPSYEYVGGGRKEISFELYYNDIEGTLAGFEGQTSIKVELDKLLSLLEPTSPIKDILKVRASAGIIGHLPPPPVYYGWGLEVWEVKIQNIDINELSFNSKLQPVIATARIALEVVEDAAFNKYMSTVRRASRFIGLNNVSLAGLKGLVP